MGLNANLDLIADLSKTTDISPGMFSKLKNLSELLISNYVFDKIFLQEKEELEIDVGIGTLTLQVDQVAGEVRYDFIPSSHLEGRLIRTLSERVDLLEEALVQNLSAKMTATYKELV